MQTRQFFRIFISLLVLFHLFYILPIIVAVIYKEYHIISSFSVPFVIVILIGIPLMLLLRADHQHMNLKQGLLLVPLCWFSVSVMGSIPYMLSGVIPQLSAALFETSSGLTTTGATVLSDIEIVPKAILFWRSLTHWLGGMGIVVLIVALFPSASIGGNIMIATESPGPSLEKITPKINHMAKIFWLLYTVLTVLEIVLLLLGGMNLFDAITHAFATLATGGFSTQNTSIAEYSSYIQIVIIVFMILAGINFSMYFLFLTRSFSTILRDSELKMYLFIIVMSSAIIIFSLVVSTNAPLGSSIRDTFFQVVSFITTTGFVSTNYELWPNLAQAMLFLLMFVGGCAGSTGGGIKVIRITVILKYIKREINKIFSPMRVQHITVNRKKVEDDYIKLVMFFVFCYIAVLLFTTLVISADNHDLLTSFTTALATLGNIGPGFAKVGPIYTYEIFSPWLKTFLSIVMITGRLELFAVLIIFSPKLWK